MPWNSPRSYQRLLEFPDPDVSELPDTDAPEPNGESHALSIHLPQPSATVPGDLRSASGQSDSVVDAGALRDATQELASGLEGRADRSESEQRSGTDRERSNG